jgi:hypothetical protein
MSELNKPFDKLIVSLEERVRELNCIYEIEEILSNPEWNTAEALIEVIKVIPIGWQYPDICRIRIFYKEK